MPKPLKPSESTKNTYSNYAKKLRGKCLSVRQVKNRIKIRFCCSKGHKWVTSPAKVRLGRWCFLCRQKEGAKKLRSSIVEYRDIAKKRRGACLSKHYINAKTKLEFICRNGHRFFIAPSDVKQGAWCYHCGRIEVGNRLRNSIGLCKILANERGGLLLSREYRRNSDVLLWRCKYGHEFEMSYANARNGKWCSICSTGKSERICRNIFEQIFRERFPKKRPNWLISSDGNRMELDGYSDKLGIAFEHQGEQHYSKKTHFIKTNADLARRRRLDREKRLLCKKHGIRLIEIPSLDYRLDEKKLPMFLKRLFVRKSITVPRGIRWKSLRAEGVFNQDQFEAIKTLIEQNGGTLLSKEYRSQKDKLTVMCAKGHIWHPLSDNLKKGSWCSHCSRRARLTLKDCQKVAKAHGGRCLSKRYKGANQELWWECRQGHKWKSSLSHVKNGGRWCRKCKR